MKHNTIYRLIMLLFKMKYDIYTQIYVDTGLTGIKCEKY